MKDNTKWKSLNIREQRLKENCKCGKYNPESTACKCSTTKSSKRNTHRDFLFGRITEQEYNKE